MKPLKTAILVGAVAAVVAWGSVYIALHEPGSRQMPDGSILIICGPGEDTELTATVWAGVAYVAGFTPTLLFLQSGITPIITMRFKLVFSGEFFLGKYVWFICQRFARKRPA